MAKPAAPDPAIGVWKLNLTQSSFVLAPAPKNSVMKFEACGDGLRVSTDTIDAQGYKIHRETAFKFDGRDYLLKGSPFADSISAKRINQRTSESIWKQNGKAVLTVRTVISLDGKTLNMTRTAVGAGPAPQVDEVLVYDRQ